MSANSAQAAVGDTVMFTFVFANTSGEKVSSSLVTNNQSLEFYGGNRVTICNINGQTLYLKPGTEVSNGEVLTCSFPYVVTSSDGINGNVSLTVSLNVFAEPNAIGDTSASVNVVITGGP